MTTELEAMGKARSIILVPGSFHSTAYYHLVIERLKANEYPGRIVQCPLPSNGAAPGSPCTKSIDPDIEAIEVAIAEEVVTRQTPVLLVAHSYGSVPAACAIKRFADSGMVKFLIVAGIMLKVGDSVLKYCPEPYKPPPIWKVKDDFCFPDEDFITMYNGVPDDEREKVLSGLQWQPIAPSRSTATFEGWAAVPTTYVACTEDQAIPPVAQDLWFSNVKERGANVEVVRIDTGHMPMLSEPDKLVDIILRCAQ